VLIVWLGVVSDLAHANILDEFKNFRICLDMTSTPTQSDCNSPNAWTLYNERVFLEELLQSRFNFFLVTFSLIVAGAASIIAGDTSDASKPTLIFLLVFGLILCILMWATIYRIYVKVDIVLEICYENSQLFDEIKNRIIKKEKEKEKEKLHWFYKFISAFFKKIEKITSEQEKDKSRQEKDKSSGVNQIIGIWIPMICIIWISIALLMEVFQLLC
jgi:hypothetical protein